MDQLPKSYCYLPFIKDETFLSILKQEYAESLKEANVTIAGKQTEQRELKGRLQSIARLESLQIGGILYKKLVMPRDWEFVKENQKLVRIIKKTEVDHLFATNYLYEISSENMLQSLKSRTEYYILADFTSRNEALQHKVSVNNELIEKNSNIISQIREEIKTKFLNYLNSFSAEIKSKTEVIKKEIDSCGDRIKELENEIKSIGNQIESIDGQ